MPQLSRNRRQFLQTAAAAGGAAVIPYWFTSHVGAQEQSQNDRHTIGCIGTGFRWTDAIGPQLKEFGDIVAVCDVDKNHAENNGLKVAGEKANTYEDYRRVLDRQDIDIVTIATPDHWHSKILVEAMQAGKDVYCEKPMTLTIDEGKKICQVQQRTGRVVQVGTQQRSEFNVRTKASPAEPAKTLFQRQFLLAVALAHSGKLGNIQRVKIILPGSKTSPAIPKADVPAGLNWEMWLGQTPLVDYLQEATGAAANRNVPLSRCHAEFRWWLEYSGGILTDWGAHHVDIAQWAIGMDHSGPSSVDSTGEMAVPYQQGTPTVHNQYNCAVKFNVVFKFPNEKEILINSGDERSISIEGDQAEIKISRDSLKDVRGNAVAGLAEKPIPESLLIQLCKGKKLRGDGKEGTAHMANFIDCVHDRSLPVSDVFTHHRAVTTCHLANISLRLNRPLQWDPEKEEIVSDSEANSWLARPQRKGYEINV